MRTSNEEKIPTNVTENQENYFEFPTVYSDQRIVGNSLQPIGVIITGNLFIKAPR